MHGDMRKVDEAKLARLLKLRGDGLNSREIGDRLGLSRSTVEEHLRRQNGTSSAKPGRASQARDARGRLLPKAKP